MKKLLFLLPILTLGSLGLTGCPADKRARITYGTLVETEAEELVYGSLAAKVTRNENLLVAVYQDSLSCGCWTRFKEVIDEYVKEYKTKVYYIARSQFSEDADNFGLTLLNDISDPTFAFIKDGKKANEYRYGKDTKPMFEQVSSLRKAISKIAKDPQYYYVDRDYLHHAVFEEKQKKVVVQYFWNFCPDCNDCFPNVMVPYSEKHDFNTKVYLIDLAIKGILKDDAGIPSVNHQTYIDFMEEYHLSANGDEVFGYDRGFVPSTQIWEKGVLKDATVYFNDSIEKVGNEYKIKQSFYSKDRAKNLAYTDTVLEGMTIPEKDIYAETKDGVTTYTWEADAAREYHKPLLEAFFDKYL